MTRIDFAPCGDRDRPPNARAHAALIAWLDPAMERTLYLLVELNLDEDTLVIFVSDNGADLRWEGQFDSCGPLRGRKRDLYEGGIRAPMIVRQPATVPAGTTSDLPAWFPDILPALADVAGAAVPRGLDRRRWAA